MILTHLLCSLETWGGGDKFVKCSIDTCWQCRLLKVKKMFVERETELRRESKTCLLFRFYSSDVQLQNNTWVIAGFQCCSMPFGQKNRNWKHSSGIKMMFCLIDFQKASFLKPFGVKDVIRWEMKHSSCRLNQFSINEVINESIQIKKITSICFCVIDNIMNWIKSEGNFYKWSPSVMPTCPQRFIEDW